MQGIKWLCTAALGFAACTVGASDDSLDNTSAAVARLPQSSNPYTLFETLQVRPLALSPSGKLLFAVNTPDNRLEIFKVNGNKLIPIGSVGVGLEPVAVA